MYTTCPVCSSSEIDPLLTVKDHSVSGQSFVIWQCRSCGLRFTQDPPSQQDIGPYYQSPDYISHTNTAKGLINRTYQKVRKYTLKQKAALVISHTVRKGNILDLGAGIGAFLNTMKVQGWEGIGIEPDAGARKQASVLYNIQLQELEGLDTLPAERFDAITLWHVLEHIHELHSTVDKLKSLLRPGGKLFIAVPNYQSVDHAIYKLYWAAYDVPRHLYHFSPKSIETLARIHGFKLKEKKPMWFDSFYISLLSSGYKNGKPSWIGAGISGLRSTLATLVNRDKSSSITYILEK